MDHPKKSQMAIKLNAKDFSCPKTLSPIFQEVKNNQKVCNNTKFFKAQEEIQNYSKQMQVALKWKHQRVFEVIAFFSPGSPQLKSKDEDQPLSGEIIQQQNRKSLEAKFSAINVEKVSAVLQTEIKSKLFLRRTKK